MQISGIDIRHPLWVSPLSYWMSYHELIYAIGHLSLWCYLKSTITLLDIKKINPRFYNFAILFCRFVIAQTAISILFYFTNNKAIAYDWLIFTKIINLLFGLFFILFIFFKFKSLSARIISFGNFSFTITTLGNIDVLTLLTHIKDEIILSQYSTGISVFSILGEILCISLVIALNSRRVYRENLQLLLVQQKALLEKQEMQRQIASDLHDDIGSSLSSIALLSERIKVMLKDSLPDARILLDKISKSVKSSIDNTQTIIWAIDTRYDKLSNLINQMKEFSGALGDIQKFEWVIPPKNISEKTEITPDLKKNLFLIFKESINNAVKYAESEVIYIKISIEANIVEVHIQDLGKGFERKANGRGMGINSIEKRAEILRGVATIYSELNKGTTVTIKAPLEK